MKVRYDEGLANHIGPEPCGCIREGAVEASAGDRAGQPLSRESFSLPGADAVASAEGRTDGRDIASAGPTRRGLRPWHAWTLLDREPGGLMLDQRRRATGPHREGDEPKPAMHGHEKSDPAIVAMKLANKAGKPAAELVERRAGAEGNAGWQSTLRAQNRESVFQALGRMRQTLAVEHPRWEPYALIGPVRICAGGAQ